jgi:DNA-binding GntR family transcriptional regulator
VTQSGANPLELLLIGPNLRERQTAATAVADSLRAAIQSGALHDGVELNQVALAEHFGISRVPVREAMRALEAEGWITALPHRRAIVQALSPARVAETFEVRALLEAHLLEKSAAAMSPAHLENLSALSHAMDKMTDHSEWVAANRHWHQLLLEPSGSQMTLELVAQLTSQVERYMNQRGENVERESEAGREHQDILRALAANEVALARALLTAHIGHTRRLVLAALEERSEPVKAEAR